MDFDQLRPFLPGGMQRRSTLDPFSDTARFPSLFKDAARQSNQSDLEIAQAQDAHTLALRKGFGSTAQANDPTQGGSIFARDNAGLFANGQVTGAQGVQRLPTQEPPQYQAPQFQQPSARDAYAQRFAMYKEGNSPDGSVYSPDESRRLKNGFNQQQLPPIGAFNNVADQSGAASSATPTVAPFAKPQKKTVNGITTYDYEN